MRKKSAINYINSQLEEEFLKFSICSYASINKTVPVWWFDISPKKFTDNFYLILDNGTKFLLVFIPKGTFPNPQKNFRIRPDNNLIDIKISSETDDRYLRDIASGGTGVDFSLMIKGEFSYPESLKENASLKKAKSGKKEEQIKVDQIILKKGQTGISYENLFFPYLKGAENIVIQDPYIRLQNQFKNLLEFCVMLANNKDSEKILNLKVISWNTSEFLPQSKLNFEDFSSTIRELGIELKYSFENHHDRFIEADNGWKIILGRGLDIFEKPEGRYYAGEVDQLWRKCKACEVTFLRKKEKH